jgi:hypothetical protein
VHVFRVLRSSVSFATLTVATAALAAVSTAQAQERLCDASKENCRTLLVDLIDREAVGIDVGVWVIKDGRIPSALTRAARRGVPIRMIMDTRASASYAGYATFIADMAAAGIKMRRRTADGICHWNLMIFAGQGVVEWSGANYSPAAFVPVVPFRNHEDEVIYFSRQLLPSFLTMFDNVWTNIEEYVNYANIIDPPVRTHSTFAIDPRLNFPPAESYQDRLVPLIDQEPAGGWIDVEMYRVTQARPVDALIRAAARGVRERLYFDPAEYANPQQPGNRVQIDRLVDAAARYPGTIEIRMRAHEGLNHQKAVWLHAQHIVVFGTSDWSDASENQLEANMFSGQDAGDPLNDVLFDELNRIFDRKWSNAAPDGSIETRPYKTPVLPPPTQAVCTDPEASNAGEPLPCEYPAPDPTACSTIRLDDTALFVGAGEANWTINVTAPSSTCAWTATSDSDWLIVKSTSPTPPAGSGYVKVRAVTNTSPRRVGRFLIGGVAFTVTQGSGARWPNEPPGLTVLSDWGFDQIPPTADDLPIPGSPGWHVFNQLPPGSAQGWAQRSADPTAPLSPSSVYDFVFPEGMVEGTAPSTIYYDGFSADEVYVGFWWQPSSPFDFGPNGNKIAFLFNGGGATGQQFLMLRPDGRLHVLPDYPGDFRWREPNVNATVVTLGVWHRIEWYSRRSTGTLKWWLDGVLQGDHHDVSHPHPFDLFEISPTWGGNIGARKLQTDHYWFDHVHLSVR